MFLNAIAPLTQAVGAVQQAIDDLRYTLQEKSYEACAAELILMRKERVSRRNNGFFISPEIWKGHIGRIFPTTSHADFGGC